MCSYSQFVLAWLNNRWVCYFEQWQLYLFNNHILLFLKLLNDEFLVWFQREVYNPPAVLQSAPAAPYCRTSHRHQLSCQVFLGLRALQRYNHLSSNSWIQCQKDFFTFSHMYLNSAHNHMYLNSVHNTFHPPKQESTEKSTTIKKTQVHSRREISLAQLRATLLT